MECALIILQMPKKELLIEAGKPNVHTYLLHVPTLYLMYPPCTSCTHLCTHLVPPCTSCTSTHLVPHVITLYLIMYPPCTSYTHLVPHVPTLYCLSFCSYWALPLKSACEGSGGGSCKGSHMNMSLMVTETNWFVLVEMLEPCVERVVSIL